MARTLREEGNVGTDRCVVEPVLELAAALQPLHVILPRALVFRSHSAEPQGSPRVLPGLLRDGGCGQGSREAGWAPGPSSFPQRGLTLM